MARAGLEGTRSPQEVIRSMPLLKAAPPMSMSSYMFVCIGLKKKSGDRDYPTTLQDYYYYYFVLSLL